MAYIPSRRVRGFFRRNKARLKRLEAKLDLITAKKSEADKVMDAIHRGIEADFTAIAKPEDEEIFMRETIDLMRRIALVFRTYERIITEIERANDRLETLTS